jgi:uncharacterized protein
MKHTFILILLCSVFFIGSSVLNGPIREFHENGNIKKECNYQKGELNGACKEYYKNGNLKSIYNYKFGKKDGEAKLYYDSGKIRAKLLFKKDKPFGLNKTYYENGVVESEGYSSEDGFMVGLTKCYYDTGILKAEAYFDNNSKEMMAKWGKGYYPNGKIKVETSSKDGKTTILNYDEDGNLIRMPKRIK